MSEKKQAATRVVERLQAAGYETYFAGGCVRDRLLGKPPVDYDIATAATPDEVEALFDATIPVGRQFGIILVPSDGHHFEVATFREDDIYADGRRPVSVRYSTARADAGRRDFTINAMFEDPLTGTVIDHVGGRADLERRLVRAVGDPRARFREDRLRLLRAVRFATRSDFHLDEDTAAALRLEASNIGVVSAERIGEELARLLCEGHARRGLELLDSSGLLVHVLPEVAAMRGVEQSADYHPEGDVFVHTMLCVEQLAAECDEGLAWGVLLHDVAKGPCAALRDGRWTFYGHCERGAEMARAILRRLRRPNAVAERAAFLVEQHLRHVAAPQMRRATLVKFLRQDSIELLLQLVRIDANASNGDLTSYEFCRRALDSMPPQVIRPAPLLGGRDLMELGHRPGPLFREILSAVEDAQLDGEIATREEALALVAARWPAGQDSERR